ncbi:MAG: hypothetical protein WC141_02330 [Arcobacteraceae bacterium]
MKYNFIVSKQTDYNKNIHNFIFISQQLKEFYCNIHASESIDELFYDKNGMIEHYDIILKKYKKYRDIVSVKLNEIHQVNYSKEFWYKVLSYYFFRLTSALWIRYNKYRCFNVANNLYKPLKEENFFYPEDTVESFLTLLSNDLYQDQIFSIYLNTFYSHNIFDYSIKKFNIQKQHNTTSNKALSSYFSSQKVIIINSYICESIRKRFNTLKIGYKYLPIVNTMTTSINQLKRNQLQFENGDFEDNFDKFFFNALKYLLPKSFIEDFVAIYDYYNIDLPSTKYILCEDWYSNDKLAIFLAIQAEQGKNIHSLSHANGQYIEKNWYKFIANISDNYITFGWKDDEIKNLISTGFWRYDDKSLNRKKKKGTVVLFLSYANTSSYDTDMGLFHMYNSEAQKSYRNTISIYERLLNVNTLSKITYKPYISNRGIVSYKFELRLKRKCQKLKKNIEFGYDNLKFINSAKLLICGTVSSAFAEGIYYNIPTIAFFNLKFVFIKDEYKKLFNELERVGILHTNPKSLARFTEQIIDNPEDWWFSKKVQLVRKQYISLNGASNSKFLEYVKSLI